MYSLVLMMALTTGGDTPAFGCRGCCGCFGCRGCHGCCGCWGCKGCHGCCGCWGCHGCHGCCGCYCHGCCGCYGCCGAVVVPHGTPAPAPKKEGKKEDGEKKEKEGAAAANTATIVVNLPAQATLTIDGAATRSTSATRVFVTPALEDGKEYYYTLTAEMVRDGQKVTATRKVAVRAGEESRVSLEFPVASVASR
jgi:uncharacterized protein (TIGR03000 family)